MKYFILLFAALLLAGCRSATSVCQERTVFSSFLDRPEVRKYVGCNAYDKIPTRDQRDLYLLNYSQLFANYGDNVDYSLRNQAILLDPTSRGVLYSDAAIPPCRYVAGSRPVLEDVVESCKVEGDEQATALNLMRFCRDLHKKRYDDQPLEYGGPEELMIDRGEILCEELARLMVALCEVAGLPGRIVLHNVGGHYTSEVYADGKWCYMDPRMGIYFLKEDGRVASIAELMDDPEIIDRQPQEVRDDVVPYAKWGFRAWKCKNIYFTPGELNCFSYYSLADSHLYHYEAFPQSVMDPDVMYYNARYAEFIQKLTPPIPEEYR